ncbi:MAG: aspartyl/asparaginyl beta-hydroxylase domain-containing protein [Colwellia sp.]
MFKEATTFPFDRSKLNIRYDVERLQTEVEQAIKHWPDYVYYSVIPLTMAGKRNDTITDYSNPNWATWEDTPLLKKCPYIQEVLDSLDCKKTNVRLLRLEAGGIVQEHTDPQLNIDLDNQVRLHIPVFVSRSVDFLLNGTKIPLKAGELWYMRLSDPHSVHNHGQTERVQLSIDVVVNDWIRNLIAQGALEI